MIISVEFLLNFIWYIFVVEIVNLFILDEYLDVIVVVKKCFIEFVWDGGWFYLVDIVCIWMICLMVGDCIEIVICYIFKK